MGDLDGHIYPPMHKTDANENLRIAQGTLSSAPCDLMGRKYIPSEKRGYVYITAHSLCCTAETNTAL